MKLIPMIRDESLWPFYFLYIGKQVIQAEPISQYVFLKCLSNFFPQ